MFDSSRRLDVASLLSVDFCLHLGCTNCTKACCRVEVVAHLGHCLVVIGVTRAVSLLARVVSLESQELSVVVITLNPDAKFLTRLSMLRCNAIQIRGHFLKANTYLRLVKVRFALSQTVDVRCGEVSVFVGGVAMLYDHVVCFESPWSPLVLSFSSSFALYLLSRRSPICEL